MSDWRLKGTPGCWSAERKERIRVAVSQTCGRLEPETLGWDQRSPVGAGRGSLSPAEHQEAQEQQQHESECAARPPPQAPLGHLANAAGRHPSSHSSRTQRPAKALARWGGAAHGSPRQPCYGQPDPLAPIG